ncbi:MAG TPA: enoyl-CoA hydratase-related protein [Pseudonocardia sp.]|jgi:2-(1,2-epoxy-1,2-dihydrophenyl)acetyl-CoA isomerase|nr:enoyl-CoA hydratase-related protein [Pseudonocardia sp.]
MSSDAVKLDVEDGVARVVLARPRARNAWDDTLGQGMTEVFAELAERVDVRCVLLTGEGSVFCAGADLVAGFPALPDGRDDLRTTLRRRFHPGFLALLDLPQPVVAAVHGPAIGAGACLALAADIVVMAEDTYLQFRFAKIGLMPDVGATALLASRVGAAKAAELFMLADPIDAAQCAQLGLVSRVVPAASVADDGLTVARRLATGPTQAYATTKRALRAWSWRGLVDQLELEASLQQTLIGTDDWREGRAAFQERREPRFTGR